MRRNIRPPKNAVDGIDREGTALERLTGIGIGEQRLGAKTQRRDQGIALRGVLPMPAGGRKLLLAQQDMVANEVEKRTLSSRRQQFADLLPIALQCLVRGNEQGRAAAKSDVAPQTPRINRGSQQCRCPIEATRAELGEEPK